MNQDENILETYLFSSGLSTFFSFSGRTFLNTSDALLSRSLTTESFSSIGISIFRASMMSLALVSTSLLINYARNNKADLSLELQFSIAVFSCTLAALPSRDINEISKEIVSTGIGILLTTILVNTFSEGENEEVEKEQPPTNTSGLKLN